MSTDTPGQRAEATPEWAPLPPAAPKPPRDPKRVALIAGGVTLAVILIATAVFALRGQSRPTTANTAEPTATSAPTATAVPTATTVPTATPEPGAAPAAPVSLYVASSDISTGASKVIALNPADGSVRWQNDSLRGVPFTPAVGGNRVFVLMVNGPLVAVQALDGKELWRVAHPPVGVAPLLDGDIVFTAAFGDSSHNGSVVAYSAASGAVVWQKDLDLNARVQMDASGGTLYLNLGQSLETLRGNDGTLQWQHTLDTPGGLRGVDPVVVDGTIYFNNYGEVFAFNAADGSPRWHYRPQQLFSEGATTLTVGGGFVLAGSGSSVIALHVADGSLAWSKQYHNIVFGTTYADGVVYTSLENGSGTFMALHAADGQQLWTSPRLSGDEAFPNASHGALYAWAGSVAVPAPPPPTIYALRPADGSIIWQRTVDGAGAASLVVG